ncbi:hypothetical protein BX666DRAFT_2024566 [Dichotomocladium elegans]|nr:hypothetical protein BX666DRAFT_2024566 [Dichotomocladium elegans]
MLSAASRPNPSSLPSQQSQSGSSNPLTDLIRTEQAYIETLKLIDSIASIWMKHTASAAPDFSEQLTYAHAILIINKRFCTSLVKVAGDPHAMRELGDILMQWVEDIERPYSNFLRNYISGIDSRMDILNSPSIRACLDSISSAESNASKLKTLFDAPVQRLSYYKELYSRLLKATKPGRADHDLLVRANRRIDALLQVSELTDSPSRQQPTGSVLKPPQETLFAFLKRSDCTGVMDFFTRSPVAYRPLPSSKANSRIILQDDFVLTTPRGSFGVHLVLTPCEVALFRIREADNPKYSLLHPPFPAQDVSVQSTPAEHEYLVNFQIRSSHRITLKADSREARNAWVGVSANAPNAATLDRRPLTAVIAQQLLRIENRDTTDPGEIYALYEDEPEQRSESAQKRRDAFRDTIMDLYSGRIEVPGPSPSPPAMGVPYLHSPVESIPHVDQDGQDLASIAPRAVKILSTLEVDSEAAKEKKLPKAPVQMTYIQPSVHTINVESGSPTVTVAPISLPRSSSKKNVVAQKPGFSMHDIRSGLELSIDTSPAVLASSTYSGSGINGSPGGPFPQPLPNSTSPAPHSPYKDGPLPPTVDRGTPTHTLPPMRQASLSNSERTEDSKVVPESKSIPHFPNNNIAGGRLPPGAIPRIDTYSPSSPSSDFGSPPQSPGAFANATRKIVYTHDECDVFHWKNQTWYAAQSKCSIQIRLTNANRYCISMQLLNSGQLYLNAWILPNTFIQCTSKTDVSLSVIMGVQKETYLIHMEDSQDTTPLYNALLHAFDETVRILTPQPKSILKSPPMLSPTDRSRTESILPPDSKTSREEAPQTLKLMFRCRCKLFAQQEHATWNSLGGATLRISLQLPSNKMHIYIENGKTKLVSSVVQSCNVERNGTKRLTFLLMTGKSSMVYMINLKDEQTTNKIYQYIKVDNSRNGW